MSYRFIMRRVSLFWCFSSKFSSALLRLQFVKQRKEDDITKNKKKKKKYNINFCVTHVLLHYIMIHWCEDWNGREREWFYKQSSLVCNLKITEEDTRWWFKMSFQVIDLLKEDLQTQVVNDLKHLTSFSFVLTISQRWEDHEEIPPGIFVRESVFP